MLGEYKIEEARVKEVEARGAWVETVCGDPDSTEGCASCGSEGCGSAGNRKRTQSKVFVRGDGTSGLSQGQRLRIQRFIPNEALAAGIVFGIPIICAVAALMVVYQLAPAKAESPFGAIVALVCLVGGFGVVAAAERLWERAHPAKILETGETADSKS